MSTATDDGRGLIDLALNRGKISEKQARLLKDELDMFPGQKAANLMLKRQILKPDELARLQSEFAKSGSESLPRSPVAAPRSVRRAPGPATINMAAIMGKKLDSPSIVFRKSPNYKAPANLSLRGLPVEKKLTDYLGFARRTGCSDLHLCIGRPPFVRLHGEIQYLKDEVLTAESSEELNFAFLTPEQKLELEEELQVDFPLEVPEIGRMRCNVYKQALGWEGAYRLVPPMVRSIEELGLPPVTKMLTEFQQGLILVTGPSGSGKNTTVAAMLDHINRTRTDHIITIEDPIEYVIPPRRCRIMHREVNNHTDSFATALRAALRQDPDIISIGEMRDLETASIAISAAETGHLVLSTLHTNSVIRSVSRVMNMYPPNQREQIQVMVSESLRGVISQQLIPRKDGKGLALALEILINTSGVAQLIRENKMHQIPTLMQGGKRLGMRTMDDSLMELYEKGIITGFEAYLRAENKPGFEAVKGDGARG
jgi:twitching motility protein PilT